MSWLKSLFKVAALIALLFCVYNPNASALYKNHTFHKRFSKSENNLSDAHFAASLSYPTPNVLPVGTVATLSPTVTGGATTLVYTAATLPAGLSLNAGSGIITGTPTTPSAATNYTIKVTTLSSGTLTFVISIAVNPATPTITSNPTSGTSCGAGTVTLTAASGAPTGGTYTWYNAAGSPAIALATGTTYAPLISGSYYATYTSGTFVSANSSSFVVTINPIVSTPISGAAFSYPFNGNSVDVSGNQDNGIGGFVAASTTGPTLTTDRFGAANSAYNFDGVGQYMYASSQITNANGPTVFSLSLWFKTTTTTGGKLIGYQGNTGPSTGQYDRHIYMANNGQLFFGTYSSGFHTINSTKSYNDGIWHHVVATLGPTNGMVMYVDGSSVASSTFSSAEPHTGYWQLGGPVISGWPSSPTSSYFAGTIDDVSVNNNEETAAQATTSNDLNLPGYQQPVCVGIPITMYAPNITGATYKWTDPNGVIMNVQNPVFPSAALGNYTLVVTGGPGGCSSTATVTPTIYALPSAAFTATSAANTGAASTITYTGSDPSTSTYAWTFTGGTPSTGTGQGPFSVAWASSGSHTVSLTVTNANGCSATATQTVTVGTYAYSLPVTLNTSSLGISSDLSNFPFLVSITDPSLVVSPTSCSNKVQFPKGPDYDFAFYDATNTEIPYEVESYNSTTGTLLVWVKLTILSHSTNNALTFYYGSVTAPGHTTAFHQSTWASDYQAVYHFNEGSFTGSITDATSNGHTGITNNMVSSDFVSTGKINTAYNFVASGNKSISVASGVSVTGPFTASAWVNLGATGADQKVLTNQATGGSSSGGYKLGVFSNNSPESESGTAVNRGDGTVAPAMAASTWHYIQTVFTGTTLYTYEDGAPYQALATTTAPTSTTPFYIGVGEGGTSYYFTGTIDEARVSNVAKTTDWLTAEFKNQNAPATYTTTTGVITTNLTNAELIYGGVNFSTPDGVNYTYSSNGSNISATPTNSGKEDFTVTGSAANLSATANVYGYTVNSSSTVNLNGQILNVGCNIVNNGSISSTNNASAINWIGSLAAQSYTGSSSSVGQAGNLTVNNTTAGTVSVTGAGNLSIYNTLNITKGNLAVINTGGASLSLKSTSTLSASVTAIPSSYSITGNVNVERAFKAGTIAANTRNYRLLSSPVANATGVNPLAYLNSNSGTISGVFTAGPGAGYTVTNATPTIYLYKESLPSSNVTFNSGNFKGVNNISGTPLLVANDAGTAFNASASLTPGNGFMLYYCGNNTANVTSTTALNKQFRFGGAYINPDASTTTAIGPLNQQNVTVSLWYNSASTALGNSSTHYNLVGNPYASSIDLNLLINSTNAPNISANVYVFNYTTKNYGIYPVTTGGSTGTNNATNIIASGQGFFVVSTASGTPSLTFNEAVKTTVQPNNVGGTNPSYLLMGLPAGTPQTQLLRVKVAKDTINTDDIMILFEPAASNKYEQYVDADRIDGNGNVSTLASYSSNSTTPLGINHMHSIDSTTRIKLYVNVSSSTGIDTLSGSGFASLDPRYDAYLIDHYKNDSLLFSKYPAYLFNINNADTTSYGANRFEIVFHKKSGLDYKLLSFTGAKVAGGILLTWHTADEQNLTGFQVQRADGTQVFIALSSLQSDGSGTYTYLDKTPFTGINYYKLQQDNPFDVISYSTVISVNTNGIIRAPETLTLYPNPVSSQFNVIINTNVPNQIILKVTNATGQVLINRTMAGSNIQQAVSNLLPGSYVVSIIDNSTKKIIGEKKFIKQ